MLYGSLTGNVTDTSGALVPNATVKAVDTLTGFNRTVRSNDAGIFKFSDLIPGSYTVTITAEGYGPFEQKGLAVQVNTVDRVDAALNWVPLPRQSP